MTVPDRTEAAALLLSLHPPAWFLRHARAVAEIAGWLALRSAERGSGVNRRLVEAAALLHDIDKLLPASDPAAGLPHGLGSAAWLTARGHGELGAAVGAHAVGQLLEGTDVRRGPAFASPEAQIVAYADKRAGQRLESMASRFASWRRRYPDRGRDDDGSWSAGAVALATARAAILEAEVCASAGARPEDVRRLGWTDRALRAAASLPPAAPEKRR